MFDIKYLLDMSQRRPRESCLEKEGEQSRQEGAVRIITQTVADVLLTTSTTKYEEISTVAVCRV